MKTIKWNFENISDVQLFKNSKHDNVINSPCFILNGCKFHLELTPNGWGEFKGTMLWCALDELPQQYIAVKVIVKQRCDAAGFVDERQHLLSTQLYAAKIKGASYSATSANGMEFAKFKGLNSFGFECNIQIIAFYDQNGNQYNVVQNNNGVKIMPVKQNGNIVAVHFHDSLDVQLFKKATHGTIIRSDYFTIKECELCLEITPNGWNTVTGTSMVWCSVYKLPENVGSIGLNFKYKCDSVSFKAEKMRELTTQKLSATNNKEWSTSPDKAINHQRFSNLNSFIFECEIDILAFYDKDGKKIQMESSVQSQIFNNQDEAEFNQDDELEYGVFDQQFNQDKYFVLSSDMKIAIFAKTGLPGVHDYERYPACRVSCPISTSDIRSQSVTFRLFQYGWFGIGNDTVKPHGFPGYTASGWMIRVTDGGSWHNDIQNVVGHNSMGDLIGKKITMKYCPNNKQLTVTTEEGEESIKYMYCHKNMPASGKAYFVFSMNYGKVEILHCEEFITINEIATQSNIKCICGSYLMRLYANQFSKLHKYKHLKNIQIFCDVCYKECKKDEMVFHCPLKQSDIHPDGYDVCEQCCIKDVEVRSNHKLLCLTSLGFELKASMKALNENNGDLKTATKLLYEQKQTQIAVISKNNTNNDSESKAISNDNDYDEKNNSVWSYGVSKTNNDDKSGTNIMTELDQLLTQLISEIEFHDTHFRLFENYLLHHSEKNNDNTNTNEYNIMYYLAGGEQNNTNKSGSNKNDDNSTNNDETQQQFNENSNTNGGYSNSGGDGNGQRDRDNDDEKKDNDHQNNDEDEDDDDEEEEEKEDEKQEQDEEQKQNTDKTKCSLNPYAKKFVPHKRWCSVPLASIAEHVATNSVPNESIFSTNRNTNVNNICNISLNLNQFCNNCEILQTSMNQMASEKDLYIMQLLSELKRKENEIQHLQMLLCQQSPSNIILNEPHASKTNPQITCNRNNHKQPKNRKNTDKNDCSKNKNKQKERRVLSNQFSKSYDDYAVYTPTDKVRAQCNIQISKDFTFKIPKLIEEHISDIFAYIDKNTSLQNNNEYNNGKIRIFNHDFHSKIGSETLYCVAEAQDKTIKCNHGFSWRMKNKLFTTNEITETYGLLADKLPKSLRSNNSFYCNVNKQHMAQIYDSIVIINFKNKIKWNKIPIYSQRPNNRGYRVKLSLNLEQFRKRLHFKENRKIIPIIMFRNDKHFIHYVYIATIVGFDCKVFKLLKAPDSMARYCSNDIIENILVYINESTDIGIAFEYTPQLKMVQPVGIHLDKQNLINNYQLLYPQNCMNDLDDFESIYEDLQIGNVDHEENAIKILRKRIEQKEILIEEMNSTDSSSSPSYGAQQLTSTSTTSSN